MKFLIALTFSALHLVAYSATIPKELHGRWASNCVVASQSLKTTGSWSGVIISSNQIKWDSQTCRSQTAQVRERRYVIDVICTPNGDEDFKATYSYELKGQRLIETSPGQNWSNNYQSCR